MFDNYLKPFEAVRKELLFLVVPAILVALSAYLLKTYTLPTLLEIEKRKITQTTYTESLQQKNILMKEINEIVAADSHNQTLDRSNRISKNSAMALLFSKAKDASIIINRSTPGTVDKEFSISLDFLCSFTEILNYLALLKAEKNTLTVDKIAINRDRSSLRCSMTIKFFNCGDENE